VFSQAIGVEQQDIAPPHQHPLVQLIRILEAKEALSIAVVDHV
jgi:hypothetical protein